MSGQGISKSAHKLVPVDPTSSLVIRDVVPNKIVTFSSPFKRFGYVKIGGRGTLVKLNTGNLAIFSPTALTDEVKAKVSQFATASSPTGSLKYIIAPDFEHHIFISPWAKEYPEAEVIGMEGLPEKREGDEANKGVKFHHIFTKNNKTDLHISPEFDADFDYEYVHSHQNKELVFFHKPTRTLIEADLLFNLPATEQYSRSGEDPNGGILTKIFGSLMNTRGDMKWQKRVLYYGPGGSDRPGFAESMRKIKQWGDFDRIIPCHGDVIETGGSRILREATAWFDDAK